MRVNQVDELANETIFAYSRSQALEDGFLVDVTYMAKEVGFRIPVAVTCAVWDKYIAWNDADNKRQTYQDEEGRLWDILWMLYLACKHSQSSSLIFSLYAVVKNRHSKRPVKIKLKSVIGGGDNGTPVITIMLPNED